MDEFVEYVLRYYGPGGLREWDPPATKEEVQTAAEERFRTAAASGVPWGGGDTTDREMTRDLMLRARGLPEEGL